MINKKAAQRARPCVKMRVKFSLLMLHCAFDRERPLAGLVIDAEDRILVELHQELRLEGSGVAAGIIEDGAIREECGTTVCGSVRSGIARRNVVRLLHGDIGVRCRRAGECWKHAPAAVLRLSERTERIRERGSDMRARLAIEQFD